MESKPDKEFRYIGHVVDHFTILHSDNGSEFINDVIKSLLLTWPGKTQIVNGSPRHSQSQGLVEQGNFTIERLISSREYDSGQSSWLEWLIEIQCKFNVNYCFFFLMKSLCSKLISFIATTMIEFFYVTYFVIILTKNLL
nr:uncharacterized protein LOC124816377 [Hydra vulgaris]